MSGVKGALILLLLLILFVVSGIGAVSAYSWILFALIPDLGEKALLLAMAATLATYMILLYKIYPYSLQD